MIRPSQQWALMIDITNNCGLHCANCTRALDHRTKATSFYMSPYTFLQAVEAVKDFPTTSEPCVGIHTGRRKVVGLIGGEPLLHPDFPELVDIMVDLIPDRRHRGLWTSKDWVDGSHPKWGSYRKQVERLLGPEPTHDASGPVDKHSCGYINWNMHLPEMKVHHQPILTASQDLVLDPVRRWELISQCWVQEQWSASITPKGFFFCEVAAALDMILDGPGGIPVMPPVWWGDLSFASEDGHLSPRGMYADQIRWACEKCGACVPQEGRLDSEDRDDMSGSNIKRLLELKSPRVLRGDFVVHTQGEYDDRNREGWKPMQYVKAPPPQHQARVARGEADTEISARRLD